MAIWVSATTVAASAAEILRQAPVGGAASDGAAARHGHVRVEQAQVGVLPLQHMLEYVDDIVTVEEEEIANAILLLLEREKMLALRTIKELGVEAQDVRDVLRLLRVVLLAALPHHVPEQPAALGGVDQIFPCGIRRHHGQR